MYYNKYQSKVDLHRSNFGIACIKQVFEGVAGDKLRQTCDGRILFVGPVDKRKKKNEKILSAFITDIMKIQLHIACFGYSGAGKFSIERMKNNFVSLFPHERRFKHAYLIGLSSNGISALIARNINRESKKIWVIDKLASPLRPDLFSKHLHSGCLPYSSLFERLLLCKMLQNRIYGVKKMEDIETFGPALIHNPPMSVCLL